MSEIVADAVVLEIAARMDKFELGLKQAVKQSTTASKKMQSQWLGVKKTFASLGNTAKSVGKKMTIGLTLALSAAGFGMIKAASDAEEMQGKFKAVFQEQSRDVEKWARSFGDSVGRSRLDLMEMASGVQDTFVPLGFARDKAAEMSKTLSELAVDVASFNNASDTETMNLFKSALVGNHEAVRRFGIVITEATMKQELARVGADKLKGAALEQAKVQARLNLIMKATSDAQGDAERTANSTANQTKKMRAQFKDLSADLGTAFLPIANQLIAWATEAVNMFSGLSDETQIFVVGAAALVAALGPALAIFGTLITVIGAILSPIGLVVVAVAGLVAAIVLFREEIATALKPIGQFFVTYLVEPVDKALTWMREKIGGFLSWYLVRASKLLGFIGFDELASKLETGSNFMQEWADGNIDVLGILADGAAEVAGNAIDAVKDRFKEVIPELMGTADSVKKSMLSVMEDAGVNTPGPSKPTSGGANPVAVAGTAAAEVTESAFTKAAKGISETFDSLSVDVTDVFGSIGNSLKSSIMGSLNSVVSDMAGGLLKSLGGGLSGIFGFAATGGKRQGPTIVGENGPEIITPTRPVTVLNNHDTNRMLGGGGGGANVYQTNNFSLTPEPTIDAWFDRRLPQMIAVTKAAVMSQMQRGV
ncbi:MAG: phage tail tape measure protein [Kordiimonadaceae bacterium]|nr:phage tail tape measure protein [Kordiimonadaceae bacterium]